jgi:hypothetical protein
MAISDRGKKREESQPVRQTVKYLAAGSMNSIEERRVHSVDRPVGHSSDGSTVKLF